LFPFISTSDQSFSEGFSYAIAQNKGDSKGIQVALGCIIPHAFGDHSNCAAIWCGFKTDPVSYKHKDLPYGKDLHGEKLKSALNNIFKDTALML